MNLAAIEIKAFLPAGDFERSKRFYAALGFEIPWSSEELAYVRHGGTSFLLQAFDEPGFARNYQMHLLVENVDDWHAHVRPHGHRRALRGDRRHAARPAVGHAGFHAGRSQRRPVADCAEHADDER